MSCLIRAGSTVRLTPLGRELLMYLQRSAAASIFQDPFYAEIFERNVKIGTGSSNSGQVCVSHGGTSDLGDVVEITKKM